MFQTKGEEIAGVLKGSLKTLSRRGENERKNLPNYLPASLARAITEQTNIDRFRPAALNCRHFSPSDRASLNQSNPQFGFQTPAFLPVLVRVHAGPAYENLRRRSLAPSRERASTTTMARVRRQRGRTVWRYSGAKRWALGPCFTVRGWRAYPDIAYLSSSDYVSHSVLSCLNVAGHVI